MRSALSKSERGTVYVEFLVVLMPFLTLFFGLTQLGLIYAAKLMVGHAAARAARAAIVILPDDHEDADYDGVPVNQVKTSGNGTLVAYDAPDKGRYEAIRRAARLTLAPVSPSIESYVGGSLAEALGDNSALSYMAGYLGWTDFAVKLSFPDGEGGSRTSFDANEPITVRISFLYKCSVPLARRLMCSSTAEILTKQSGVFSKVGPLLDQIVGGAGWSFIELEAERTLPNQGK